MNEEENRVLAALRANSESERTTADGLRFASVYLDNAKAELGMSARQFAGYLSALEAKGLYQSQGDDCFGDVLIDKAAA